MAAATQAQLDYIQLLLRKLPKGKGAPTVPPDLDIDGASALIDTLKARVAKTEQATTATTAPAATATAPAPAVPAAPPATGAALTAAQLQDISVGAMPAPESMSDAEHWILYRLAKLTDLELALGEPVSWAGANGGGPILVEHLVAYFGSVEAVATAFKVAVGTVRSGWSGIVPANRAHEAAWLTRGYVQPPR